MVSRSGAERPIMGVPHSAFWGWHVAARSLVCLEGRLAKRPIQTDRVLRRVYVCKQRSKSAQSWGCPRIRSAEPPSTLRPYDVAHQSAERGSRRPWPAPAGGAPLTRASTLLDAREHSGSLLGARRRRTNPCSTTNLTRILAPSIYVGEFLRRWLARTAALAFCRQTHNNAGNELVQRKWEAILLRVRSALLSTSLS
jgi:hypothetical protein